MDDDYALAFALANDALCLFAGAGLSKHLTCDAMPDWPQLLDAACAELIDSDKVRTQLAEAAKTYPLEDCAQILELAFLREQKDLRQSIAQIVAQVPANPAAFAGVKSFLEAHPSVSIVTTNFDLLLEDFVLPGACNSNYPGKPISRKEGAVDIYHVHGCIKNPSRMVTTTNDYYEFINEPSYFAQKIETLMHENSMLILGYSLSDPNLKAILNSFRSKEMRAINRGNLFFVTRDPVPTCVRDYYETAYGLSVIENTEIDQLLLAIEAKFPVAKSQVETAVSNLADVLSGKKHWTPQYLKLSDALFHIIATANTIGTDIHSPEFAAMIKSILEQKKGFTGEKGAWEQYAHFASWLVYLGSIMDWEGTTLEASFLDSVKHSMQTMSKSYTYGYSWGAFRTWKTKWSNLTFQNRLMIRKLAESERLGADALEVVLQ